MKHSLFFFCLLLPCVSLTQAPSSHYTVPFQMRSKLIVFQAVVDGQTGYFILDTGIERLLLNMRYFRWAPSRRICAGVDGRCLPVEERLVDLEIGNWRLPNTQADITDLRALEVYTGLPIFGNAGGWLFKDCELVIDYTFRELTIYPHKKSPPHRNRHTEAEAALSFKYKGAMPGLEVQIGARTFRFGLDTGAGANVLDPRRRKDVRPYFIARKEQELATFGNSTATTIGGELHDLKVNGQSCRPMPTLLASLDGTNRQLIGPQLDGLLGYPFLSRYRVAIHFRKREIRLWSPETVREQYLAYQEKHKGNNR